jgi:hypothetical protein
VHARRPFFAMADIEENARRKASGKKEIALSPNRLRAQTPARPSSPGFLRQKEGALTR